MLACTGREKQSSLLEKLSFPTGLTYSEAYVYVQFHLSPTNIGDGDQALCCASFRSLGSGKVQEFRMSRFVLECPNCTLGILGQLGSVKFKRIHAKSHAREAVGVCMKCEGSG